MAKQRPEIRGVYRFEFTVEGDYLAIEKIVTEVRGKLFALDGRAAYRWEKLENGKPVWNEWPGDDG